MLCNLTLLLLFVQKLAGTQTCGYAMPIGGMISADQLQQVRAWISAGAHDD